MNHKISKKGNFTFFLIALILFSPFLGYTSSNEENLGAFFSINILAPYTSYNSYHFTLIAEQLPKIGIAVDVFDQTGWAQISPRTWRYPGPYPIPTYPEGGYDVLFVGWSWGLDWDPTGLYNTAGITPDGDNFYQYSNPTMDLVTANYYNSFNLSDRINWCKEIQNILYEDLPEIAIYYQLSVYPHVDGFTGWSGLLWASIYQPMENWEIPGQSEFHYATPADFEDFHIHTYESVYDAQWLHQIYNGLVERDPALGNGYGPRIAESFSSADGKIYNIKIKNSAVWADGVPLTVDDVIYNYQLAVTPDLGGTGYSTNVLYWDNDSITKINDYEMTIEFSTPYVFQDGNVGLDLIPKHIWESVAPEDHAAQAVEWATNLPAKIFGFGPFMLEEYDSTNGVIHLAANPHFADWYGTAPKFDDVYFEFYGSKEGALAALAEGEVDMVDKRYRPHPDELNIPKTRFTLVDGLGIQEIGVNMFHPYLGTGELCPIAGKESAKHIRKAMSYVIPRELICDVIYEGLAARGVTGCPRAAVGYDYTLAPYEYDLNKALYHMAAAGFDVEYNQFSDTRNNTLLVGLTIPTIFTFFSIFGGAILFKRKIRK